mgnify:CR=1 FL=1
MKLALIAFLYRYLPLLFLAILPMGLMCLALPLAYR